MRCFLLLVAAVLAVSVVGGTVEDGKDATVKKTRKHHKKHHKKHHGNHHGKHHHHHHHHGKHNKAIGAKDVDHVDAAPDMLHNLKHTNISDFLPPPPAAKKAAVVSHVEAKKNSTTKVVRAEDTIVEQMKELEQRLISKKAKAFEKQGQIFVNGPLPADFSQLFAQSVAQATGANTHNLRITKTAKSDDGVVEVTFVATPPVVHAVEEQAGDFDSPLANGRLHNFLVTKDEKGEKDVKKEKKTKRKKPAEDEKEEEAPQEKPKRVVEATPVEAKGLDIDTAMPYGDLEPFGREDTAQELTEDSIQESNGMVDQLERAEVAEEKRAVFRSLTRLRGAAITSFDGVARSQTGNIDEYNKIHQWRTTHPLHHLADEESDISKWAFPDNADF